MRMPREIEREADAACVEPHPGLNAVEGDLYALSLVDKSALCGDFFDSNNYPYHLSPTQEERTGTTSRQT